jgi:hypothetical protein
MLSPKQYIQQRSRHLPIDLCLISQGWQKVKKANVFVFRKHTTGTHTFCAYLVDLSLLGIKDTFYQFNTDVDIEEMMQNMKLEKIDYNTAHNVIFAGYEYALEFDMKQHADFAEITKYFLEPDDDNIPIIDIEVGDENGDPQLIAHPGDPITEIIAKLEKNPGPGNYTYIHELEFLDGDDDEPWEEDDDDGFENESIKEFVKMNKQIDEKTLDMKSEEALVYFKVIANGQKTLNAKPYSKLPKEITKNITEIEYEQGKEETLSEVLNFLVKKYNQTYFEAKPITPEDLMPQP